MAGVVLEDHQKCVAATRAEFSMAMQNISNTVGGETHGNLLQPQLAVGYVDCFNARGGHERQMQVCCSPTYRATRRLMQIDNRR